MTDELTALIKKYKSSPEFLFVEFVDINQTGMTGDTLLHAAVVRGAVEDVQLLIASGANVNAIGDLGNTPLHGAASRGLVEIARLLLQSGADKTTKNEFGQTPGDLARLMKRRGVVQLLE